MTGPIVVTGGTGTLGRPVVEGLLRSGSTVRVASRRAHPDRDLAYQWAQVDYRSESSYAGRNGERRHGGALRQQHAAGAG